MGQNRSNLFFSVIQLGRWAAAFAVLCYHASQSLSAFGIASPQWVTRLCSGGFLGVDFFFVLSGFIIYYSHKGDDRTVGALSRFADRRFIRIYLPYLPIAIGLMLAYQMFPHLSASDREWSLLKSLTLLPLSGDVALMVGWTLVHEVLFYIVFGALFYGRLLITGSAAWAAGIVAYNILGLDYGPFQNVLFHALNLEFLIGVAAAYLLGKLPHSNGYAPLALGTLITLPLFVMAASDLISRIVFGLGMALIILGAAMCERDGKLRAPALSGFLGNASYALYLLHLPVLSITVRAAVALNLGWALALAIGIAACCISAFIYHRYFERPALAYLRSTRAYAPARRPSAAPE